MYLNYFYNKSLKSNFVLTKECVLETIENWAMSEEKKNVVVNKWCFI